MSFTSANFLFLCCYIHALLMSGTLGQLNDSMLQQCISEFDPDVNYYRKMISQDVLNDKFVFPLPIDLQEITTAEGFAINYGYYFKVLRNQIYNLTYMLHQCGSPPPTFTAGELPALNGSFQVPVRRVAADSTIPVAFLELLGKLETVTLTATAAAFLSSPCVLKYITDGKIKVVPDSTSNTAEVIFTSALGQPSLEDKAVSFDATFDGGPLKVNLTYQCLNRSKSDSVPKPTVAWLSFFNGTWTISGAAYKLQFNDDAGGINLQQEFLGNSFNTGNSTDVDNFQRILRSVDAVVDESFAPNPFNYSLETFTSNARITNPAEYPFLTSERVLRVDKRVGLGLGAFQKTLQKDWFEMAIPQPHVVLYDLINMLYPAESPSSFTYLRNIALGELPVNTTTETCLGSIDEALQPAVISDPEVEKCVRKASGLPPASGTTNPTVYYRYWSTLFVTGFWLADMILV